MEDKADKNEQSSSDKSEILSSVPPESSDGSHLGTISVRSLICLVLILTVCILAFISKPIPELLGNLTLSVSAFLFGHTVGSKKM